MVRIDKSKTFLKCKDSKYLHNPRHQIYTNMVKQLIEKNKITLSKHNKLVFSVDTISKLISKQLVVLFSSTNI
jgi:hypothetical protein